MSTKAKTPVRHKQKDLKGQASAAADPATTSTSRTANPKSNKSAIGAPSQLGQSSRKGKKAWRKNIDIAPVEEGLEEMRMEERVIGVPLQKTTNDDLFVVDTVGDEKVRHTLPKLSLSTLKSTSILSQRSAVPAVASRRKAAPAQPEDSSKKRKLVLTKDEKERLLKMAKRAQKGPFNAIMDPSEYQSGHSIVHQVTEAVKSSGTYDPWNSPKSSENASTKDGLEHVQKKVVKPPPTRHIQPKDGIEIAAVSEPHQGTSYNPPASAHEELVLQAAAAEEKRLKDMEKTAEVKARIQQALVDVDDSANKSGAPGMSIQPIDDYSDDSDEEDDDPLPEGTSQSSKTPKQKTQAQRNKAARVLAEQRAIAERVHQRRLLASINQAKSIRKATLRESKEREKRLLAKKAAIVEKLRKQGLAGSKLGKHRVPEPEVAVQLGEDLSDSLRGLKPEGNLFKDRFQSMQQRALIEPRVPVLPKKRRRWTVEYEKHAWKRFDRGHN